MLSANEEKVLRKIAESHLVSKNEIKELLNDGSDVDNSHLLDSVVRSLIDKKFVSAVNPVGETCFVITQRGSKMLQNL